MNRKQERELKKAINNMDMTEMVRSAEKDEFRKLIAMAYLNKLAMITAQDTVYLPMSEASSVGDTAFNILYDDTKPIETEEDISYPVISDLSQREDGTVAPANYADSRFGGASMHFRVVKNKQSDDMFVTVFQEDTAECIIITDGQWFTM